MGTDIADFNNDGLPDIITLDMLAGRQQTPEIVAASREL